MNKKEIDVDIKIEKISKITIVDNIEEALECINHAKLEINNRQITLKGVFTKNGAVFVSDDRKFIFDIIKDSSKIVIDNYYEEKIHIKKLVFIK